MGECNDSYANCNSDVIGETRIPTVELWDIFFRTLVFAEYKWIRWHRFCDGLEDTRLNTRVWWTPAFSRVM